MHSLGVLSQRRALHASCQTVIDAFLLAILSALPTVVMSVRVMLHQRYARTGSVLHHVLRLEAGILLTVCRSCTDRHSC